METEINQEAGAEQPVVAPAVIADGADDGQPNLDPHEQRLRSDPDYAVDQYKRIKGESTKLYQKTKAYEPITKIADQLGGADRAAEFLMEYAALAQHPEVAKMREHYRLHGTLPTATATRTDDTLDDPYQDPQDVRINELKSQLAMMESKLSRTEGTIGKQAIMGHFSTLKAKYPEAFEPYIMPAMTEWMEKQELTPQGRSLLNTVNFDQLDTIASKIVTQHLDEIAEKRYARRLEEKKRASTGGAAPNLTNGREPGAKQGHTSGYEALLEFKRVNGLR